MTEAWHPQSIDPRAAGDMPRYQVERVLRAQSVGEHSWQVMRILLAIYPEAPRPMLIHCLVHDVGELGAGDASFQAKRRNPALKRELDKTELDVHLAMCLPWGLPPPQSLTEEEVAIFKLAELIEMWEWSLCEQNMGNRYAAVVAGRCADAMDALRLSGAVPQGIQDAAKRYMYKRWTHEQKVKNGPHRERPE